MVTKRERDAKSLSGSANRWVSVDPGNPSYKWVSFGPDDKQHQQQFQQTPQQQQQQSQLIHSHTPQPGQQSQHGSTSILSGLGGGPEEGKRFRFYNDNSLNASATAVAGSSNILSRPASASQELRTVWLPLDPLKPPSASNPVVQWIPADPKHQKKFDDL